MKNLAGYLAVTLLLWTPLDGQVPRELRNPSPKEIIAQLLLRRAHKGNTTPAPAFRHSNTQDDGGGDGGGGGSDGGGGGGKVGGVGGGNGGVGNGGSSSSSSSSGSGGSNGGSELVVANLQRVEEYEKFLPSTQACTGSTCGPDESFTERWRMPLMKLGDKQYYLGIFFKANWYKAAQYCRFHGMHLAGVETERQNRFLEQHIQDAGLGHEHFWTSGTDQGEEGRFFWMSNGQPITYTNWNAGEPNNFQYENGEMEHCLELWNRDGKGLKWNDSPCSFETFFICEVA
ncbi:pulmonary surfactant-associated protein D isoform X1 [Cherax quadricarinatus]|uniref:pulmonary surfactant-associated protein D isoform X1 n=1 Tax=Cherax quadricarinatus TaxID=27406 RepID=UPI002378194C|nr:collectin-10-like isoform X1 [Cherax quadricarinatus]